MRRFRPYFRYLHPQRGVLSLAILCGLIGGIASGAGLPLMIDRVFPVMFAATPLPLTNWELFLIALWLPAVFVIRGVASYFNTYLIQLVGTRVLENIRRDYFAKLQVLP